MSSSSSSSASSSSASSSSSSASSEAPPPPPPPASSSSSSSSEASASEASASSASSSPSSSASSEAPPAVAAARHKKKYTFVESAAHDPTKYRPEAQKHTYPLYDNPNFQAEISAKKEFRDTKMSAPRDIRDVHNLAEALCNRPFEISSHQLFVKNFISFSTPYRSLLLFHGLGSGKTCSAINVCEVMRLYYKNMNLRKKVIVVASPKVQEEFKKQLFNERDLVNNNGVWTINSCVGEHLLDEVNPTNIQIEKKSIVSQINNLIHKGYAFMGYGEFANYVEKKAGVDILRTKLSDDEEYSVKYNLAKNFKYSLIVIDEAHNLRVNQSMNESNKKINRTIKYLLGYVTRMKLLLLSATPMYNTSTEIVNLINIMRINDERPPIQTQKIFAPNGDLLENGQDVLKEALNGYVSYVKGENPYTFPYRIYPLVHDPTRSVLANDRSRYQYNVKGVKIADAQPHLQHVDVYVSTLSHFQTYCYLHALVTLRMSSSDAAPKRGNDNNDDDENDFEQHNDSNFSFTLFNKLIFLLMIVYPVEPIHPENVSRKAAAVAETKSLPPPPPRAVRKDDSDGSSSDDSSSGSESDDKSDGSSSGSESSDDDEANATAVGGVKAKPMPKTKAKDASLSSSSSASSSSASASSAEETEEYAKYDEDELTRMNDAYLSSSKGLYQVVQRAQTNTKVIKYTYKEGYEGFFETDNLRTYSAKIHSLIEAIRSSTGIVMVFSEYIWASLVPIALALEEAGLSRLNRENNLLADGLRKPPVHYEGLRTEKELKRTSPTTKFVPARYIMITGEDTISPFAVRKMEENAMLNSSNNNAKVVKVLLISKGVSEGVDYKNIRQVHIMEPWYNLNRIEQTIGRAVRYCSHKNLPFAHRNVEIYMHGSELDGRSVSQMPADVYMYTMAERKALQMSQVTRIIKESAVDCIINKAQQSYTEESIDMSVSLNLSSGKVVDYRVGDKKNSLICDYMDTCTYKCNNEPDAGEADSDADGADVDMGTYDDQRMQMNTRVVVQRIKEAFAGSYMYHYDDLKKRINTRHHYDDEQIESALDNVMFDRHSYIFDRYMRPGYLVKLHNYYMFQPVEMEKFLTHEERAIPLYFKKTDFIPAKPQRLSSYSSSSSTNSYSKIFSSSSSSDSESKTTRTAASTQPTKRWQRPLKRNYEEEDVKNLLQNCDDMFELASGDSSNAREILSQYKDIGYAISSTSIYNRNWYFTFHEIALSERSVLQRFKLTRPEIHRILIEHIVEQFHINDLINVLKYLDLVDEEPSDSIFMKTLRAHVARLRVEFRPTPSVLVHYILACNERESKIEILKKVVESPLSSSSSSASSEEAPAAAVAASGPTFDEREWNATAVIDRPVIPERIAEVKAEHESRLSKIYGRMSYDEKSNRKYMTFKIVNTKNRKSNHMMGFRIDDKGKSKLLELVKEIVGEDAVNVYGAADPPASISMPQIKVLIEVILRVYNVREHHGLRWMIQPYEQYLHSFHIMD